MCLFSGRRLHAFHDIMFKKKRKRQKETISETRSKCKEAIERKNLSVFVDQRRQCRVTSSYFCPFWKHIWWKGAELLLCPLNFPPLFISVFCELSRGRCKFSSFYLSSLDKVSEPRQHARYRHVEAIYGFRLFRTRLCAFFSSNS